MSSGIQPMNVSHDSKSTRRTRKASLRESKQGEMKVWTKLEKNPLTGKAWSSRFREILEGRSRLPAYRDRNKFTRLLAKHDCLVVVGETGSGKTTQLPRFVLAALHHAAGQKESPADKVLRVACTQPRRVAAVSVATRVAGGMDGAL